MPNKSAEIRAATARSLIRARTLALDNVEEDRIDPVQEGEAPRIAVSASTTMQGIGKSTEPKFTVSAALIVTAYVSAAQRDDCRRTVDLIEDQILEGLLGDPDWTRQAENPDSIAIERQYHQGAKLNCELTIHIKLGWKIRYQPRLNTPLAGVDLTVTPPGAFEHTAPIKTRIPTLTPDPDHTEPA
jgi:hypothetical protein